MKTKPFLLATAGATVDGRTIDDAMLDQMASSYDPKTYGARLNIEHIRGISGDKPFRAYGDVLELSVGETEVNFNGKTEKRKALFGVLDVTDDAKALNDAGQKLYPSVEIEPNFAGKGFAYLMGCALTDSPASIATERLKFNRALPGTIALTGDAAAAIEFEEAAPAAAEEVKGFFAKLTEMLGTAAPKTDPAPVKETPAAPAFDAGKFTADLGAVLEGALSKQQAEFDRQFGEVTTKLTALEAKFEATPAATHTQRPLATGPGGEFTRTDC
jgi:hypothetical protein